MPRKRYLEKHEINCPDRGFATCEFICRGCTIGARKRLWDSFLSTTTYSSEPSYLTLKPDPKNHVDPNAIEIVVRGEQYGLAGFVGREYTGLIKKAFEECIAYRLDTIEDEVSEKGTIVLKLTTELQ